MLDTLLYPSLPQREREERLTVQRKREDEEIEEHKMKQRRKVWHPNMAFCCCDLAERVG